MQNLLIQDKLFFYDLDGKLADGSPECSTPATSKDAEVRYKPLNFKERGKRDGRWSQEGQ